MKTDFDLQINRNQNRPDPKMIKKMQLAFISRSIEELQKQADITNEDQAILVGLVLAAVILRDQIKKLELVG